MDTISFTSQGTAWCARDPVAFNNSAIVAVVESSRYSHLFATLRDRVNTLGMCSASAHLSTATSGCEVVQTSLHVGVPTYKGINPYRK